VSTWLSIGGAVCVAVSIVGLVLSVLAWRKRGPRSGLRGIAWSLLPIAAWLTHSVGLIGHIVSAIVQFAGSFVFSPRAWLGVILLGVSVLLFVASGGIPLLRSRKRRKDEKRGRSVGAGTQPASVTPAGSRPAMPPAQDDDLADVRDILKRHGIS